MVGVACVCRGVQRRGGEHALGIFRVAVRAPLDDPHLNRAQRALDEAIKYAKERMTMGVKARLKAGKANSGQDRT